MKDQDIKEVIKDRYGKIARGETVFCCPSCGPTPVDQCLAVGYSEEDLLLVPEAAVLGVGCGNPTALADLKEGETVLDLGSGAGIDVFLAARKVGAGGRVIGVDMTEDMIARGNMLAVQHGFGNVEFRLGDIEHLPVASETVDVVISNDQDTALLHERHRIRAGEPDDFNVRDMSEITRALSATTMLMTNLLLCVALISLVVGGVGIMNIMLVSVTERTREIGLRMAVGARARDILRQFLIEAIALCLVGGALGILLGHGGSYLVWFFLRWPVETSPVAIAAAVMVSAGVGIAFGFYPAWKASRLDPIEALRYE